MRYLILSDIHANLEALETCLELARGRYHQVLCLGDLVGYGPDPNAVVRAVRELASVIIRGNHDKACAGVTNAEDFNRLAYIATQWTREELTAEHLAFLRDLAAGPATVDNFQLVHGSPLDEDEYILGPDEAIPALKSPAAPAILFGHTHYQGGFLLTADDVFRELHGSTGDEDGRSVLQLEANTRYLINPGSVGQPRDGDWRAAFAIFDGGTSTVEYYRTPYDLPKTQEKMRKADLPDPLVVRLQFGR